ncbi:uncharacterized protein RSE6_02113 [Rhynchosporium secalis]|uniref:Uncharacterized protein n=1 Tax=Rhynchosporium secalis TaxID=38038 RepID=A0A1E1M141_RHYSE|nr:uncharacterized protein RSE6_02113 [Rhynchosporium secalis]
MAVADSEHEEHEEPRMAKQRLRQNIRRSSNRFSNQSNKTPGATLAELVTKMNKMEANSAKNQAATLNPSHQTNLGDSQT